MFWGYTPALDLLREVPAFKDDAVASVAHHRVVITEISDGDVNTAEEGEGAPSLTSAPGPGPEGSDHVQEDYVADDSGRDGVRRVAGELPSARGDGGAGLLQEEAVQVSGGSASPLQRHHVAGSKGPMQVAHAAHAGRHVHQHGAVHVQLAGVGDHRLRSDGQVELPTPASTHRPGDTDRGEEVVLSPPGEPHSPANRISRSSAPAEKTKRAPFLGSPGLFDILSSNSREGDGDGSDCVNVLILGGLDARHVLKTLSRMHRLPGSVAKVRIYVAEAVMEPVARQLVFLLAALEPTDRMGLTVKVRLLMELLGNSLVRPSTALWLRRAAHLLVDLVTDPKLLARRLPAVDLSHLRHQDRDRLEDILAFYQERPQGFRIGFHWDQRLRKHLKTRYDSRVGAYDWDYFMTLKDLPGGDKICVHEYRHWRETGVAFTWLEGEQSEPNLSFGAGIFREGRHLLHGGYLGDIVSSPYIAYAVQLEEEDAAELFKKSNDQYTCRSTDATERHLSRIIYELQHSESYSPPRGADSKGTGILLSRVTDPSRLDPVAPTDEEDTTLRHKVGHMLNYNALPVNNAEVIFLSPKFLRPEGRHAHLNKFSTLLVGRGLAEKCLDGNLVRLLAPGALVLVEGTRFLLERREARDKYADLVQERALTAGLRPLGRFDPVADDFAKFVLN